MAARLFGQAGSAATVVVLNTNDSGPGSLRQAIIDANAAPDSDTLVFAIAAPVPATIAPLSPLPAITQPLIVDATSQPGFISRPVIELNGRFAGPGANGLLVRSSNCVIRGFVVNQFSADGIRLEGSNNVVQGNFLGTDTGGNLAMGNGLGGVTISQGANNLIGGTNASARNLISGRNASGIFIIGVTARDNLVQGNFIGTDITGASDLGNVQNGVVISDAPFNLIGGTNLAAQNVISGNDQSGIYVLGATADGNMIQGNLIGTDVTGRVALSNSADGVTIYGCSSNFIGGTAPGAGNVIAANGQRGIYLWNAGANGNFIQGNLIGTDATGTNALGNSSSGVGISGVSSNVIGGDVPNAGNLVSGNHQSGIAIADAGAVANVIQGNWIGLDSTGAKALPNLSSGISVAAVSNNVIGGTSTAARNVISGNAQNGIFIFDPGASGNVVEGNYIGTDAAGLVAVGNGLAGVRLEAARNQIGGAMPGAGNLISGNVQSGIFLFSTLAANNSIQGNFIGVNAGGTAALPNGLAGIGVSGAPQNVIGGTLRDARNIISGNGDSGIYLLNSGAIGNVIRGNYLGTDVSGRFALGNVRDGLSLYDAPSNTIGGATSGAGNLLSGNNTYGLYLARPATVGNVVQGNFIGTTFTGTQPLGNIFHNVLIEDSASNNSIGGNVPLSGNRIAFAASAGFDGVRIKSGLGNLVRRNSIFSNGGSSTTSLGIDLGVDGVTLNDAGDADDGSNHLQNFPVLTSATGRYITTVAGSLNSVASRSYVLDFYASPAVDASGYGEGRFWIGSIPVTTGSGGNASFSVTLTNLVSGGPAISATATDSANNTSEFSAGILASASPDGDGDNLPDDYELATGINSANAGQDSDGDGLTNRAEFLAGTNPNDPSSVLRINALVVSDSETRLSFSSVDGKYYRIEVSDQITGPWSPLVDSIAGTGGTIEILDYAGGQNASRFYRLSAY